MEAEPRSVLVVDDDENILEFVTTVLAALGINARGVSDSVDAWQAVHQGQYHCAIVDVHLGDENGVDLAQRLREVGISEVVLMSGDPELERLACEAGIGRTLAKPFEIECLFDLVGHAAAA